MPHKGDHLKVKNIFNHVYGTIAENIAYGRPDATPAEIVAAARAARAHEFILNLTDGYDSLVGERGQSLSGGERQRISIARALLPDPRILILDEATSSVDNETEREIQEALTNLIEGRTTIAIAHRISTLRRANRLVVLEAGQITAIGSHEELMHSSDTYARLQSALTGSGSGSRHMSSNGKSAPGFQTRRLTTATPMVNRRQSSASFATNGASSYLSVRTAKNIRM